MKYSIGDIVQIRDSGLDDHDVRWGTGETGIIISTYNRLYIPAAEVFIMGQVADFDLDELEKVNAED
jgi:hypothetical protein